MSDVLTSILKMLGLENYPWIGPALLILILAIALPYVQKNVNTDRGRSRIKRMSELPLPERQKVQQEALEIAGDDPDGLIALADEAIRQGDKVYARQVLERLKATGQKRDHVRRLERLLDDTKLQLPEQTIVAVERMIESGMIEEARKRLAPALERWPDHAELRALEQRLSESGA